MTRKKHDASGASKMVFLDVAQRIGKLEVKSLQQCVEKLSKANPPLGRKDDGGKSEFSLLPWKAVQRVTKVLMYGAKKYAPDNWRHVPNARKRYFDAALRHIIAWHGGEINDPESGLPHLAHAACCVLFLLELETQDLLNK